MKLFIPPIATKLILTKPWTFTMYMENRNNKFLGDLLTHFPKMKQPAKDEHGYYKYSWIGTEYGPVTLPEGTKLSVDRIYIRKGAKDFDSISFHVWMEFLSPRLLNKPTKIKGRFWVKLEDANTVEGDLIDDKS